MAATTQIVLPVRSASPLALWHLLSFDAPTVAALWVWFIARSAHVDVSLAVPVSMALAVWMLYAADRLLDTRHLDRAHAGRDSELEARHFFHHRHRRAFLLGIAFAAAGLSALLHSLDPAAIRLYLIEGALLFAWFVILHATRSAHRLPKEIAVGLFFAAAVFIPTVAREPSLRTSLLPVAVLFAALCSLNCLFIFAWEHEFASPNGAKVPYPEADLPSNPDACMAHATTRIAVAYLPDLAASVAIAGAALAAFGAIRAKPVAAACALAALLLLALHRFRRRFSRTGLRAAADLALLTPIFFLLFLR